MARRLLAEALGTCLLVTVVVGSGVMAERLANGNLAVALLGNTLATGAMLCVLIQILGPVSGAHFNPAVTFVFLLRREIGFGAALAYMAVQFAFAALGTALAHLMFDMAIVEHSSHVRAGLGQFTGEFVATFALVLAILGVLASAPKAVAPIVALTITGGYWFTSSTSFANPAVTFARMLTDSFSGIMPADVPLFMAAQIAGAGTAMLVSHWLWKKTTVPALLSEAGTVQRSQA